MSLKKDPKKCTIAKFENDLEKKDEEIAPRSRKCLRRRLCDGGTNLHDTPTIQTVVKVRQLYLRLH